MLPCLLHREAAVDPLWSATVAARGENGGEGCEISSLVEHTGLSPCPWLFIMAFPVTPAVLNLSNW